MDNLEVLKEDYSNMALNHTFLEQKILLGKFDYETEYTIMQMTNYLHDVQHAREQNLDICVISHLSYNLNLQLSHCYSRAVEYNGASKLFLVGDDYKSNLAHLKEFQEQSLKIKNLINNLSAISLFEIYQVCPGNFLGEYYNQGLEVKGKTLLDFEKRIACMNGVQLIKCLVFMLDLVENELADIKNGFKFKPNSFLEHVYDLNYAYYSDFFYKMYLKFLDGCLGLSRAAWSRSGSLLA